jgi:NRPS condensation-like uncharacterized protein|tara:strand:+ start:269 stop:448 length:180 start_codon:yes stop_codon:yes gene_type:complete
MKVYFYIKPKELEYLSKVLKDYNNLKEPIKISFNPVNDLVMVSILWVDFIYLKDNGCIL